MPKKSVPTSMLDRALGMIKAGASQATTSKALGISRHCIQNAIERERTTGSVHHRAGAGRKRKTTASSDRIIKRIVVQNYQKSIRAIHSEVKQADIDISTRTLCRRMAEMTFDCTPTVKRQLLTKKHKQTRVDFCRKYRDWTAEDWSRVIFSDESNFKPFQRKNKETVWHRHGVDPVERLTKLKVHGGGGGISIWGCISVYGVGCCKVYNGTLDHERYIDIIDNEIVPSAQLWYGEEDDWYFQQDNAPPHVAKATIQAFERQKIQLLDWPACSPDLNPIEHVWNQIDRDIAQLKSDQIDSVDKFKSKLREIFLGLDQNYCKNLIRSIQKCLVAKGGHFKTKSDEPHLRID